MKQRRQSDEFHKIIAMLSVPSFMVVGSEIRFALKRSVSF